MHASEPDQLVLRVIGGDTAAIARIIDIAPTSDIPAVLVVAALVGPNGAGLLHRAARLAATTRDRHLVAIATAHHAGDRDTVNLLARDHLADHPDSVLVAWIAAAAGPPPGDLDPSPDEELS